MQTHATQQAVGSYKFSGTLKAVLGLFALVGVATFLGALKVAPQRAWPIFLVNFFFFMALSLS